MVEASLGMVDLFDIARPSQNQVYGWFHGAKATMIKKGKAD
jgi:hypothetical protein